MEGHLVSKFSRHKSNLYLKFTLSFSFLRSLPHDFAKSLLSSPDLVRLCAEGSSIAMKQL